MAQIVEQAGNPEYVIQAGMAFVDCKTRDRYLPVRFMFQNQWITVDPEHYIWDVQNDGQFCMMLLMQNSYNFALLGQPIFQGYYTHHHMEDDYIAFGPLVQNGARALEYGVAPTQPLPGLKTATIIQLIIFVLYGLFCYGLFLVLVNPIMQRLAGKNTETYFGYVIGYVFVCIGIFGVTIAPKIGLSMETLYNTLSMWGL